MNQNQVKGAAKDAAGKVQRKAGEIAGSAEHQIKGAAKQAEGKTQKAVGDAEKNLKDARERNRA